MLNPHITPVVIIRFGSGQPAFRKDAFKAEGSRFPDHTPTVGCAYLSSPKDLTKEVAEKAGFKILTHRVDFAAFAVRALGLYGIKEDAWSNEDEMFAIVHQMRTRIITSPSFTGERILAAILFENTIDRDIEGQPTADTFGM